MHHAVMYRSFSNVIIKLRCVSTNYEFLLFPRLLEDLYEDHGDTLAVQYGGSQLVHR